jgi:hypothetical protein
MIIGLNWLICNLLHDLINHGFVKDNNFDAFNGVMCLKTEFLG